MTDEGSVLRIGEVARRTGIAVPTLRAWERRYQLLDPARTDGGHRLYSEQDVARVRAMQGLLADGWSAAAAARQVLREPASVTLLRAVPASGTPAREMVDRLRSAFDAFDAGGADQVLDDVLARLDIPRALDEVVLPVLRDLGDGWELDPRVIAREHFATNVLRPRLHRLLRGSLGSPGRTLLAAAPEAEHHDLGLLAGSVVAAHAGWRIHYLGARTPTAAIESGARELGAQVVMVGALYRSHAEQFLADAPTLPGSALVLGGGGFEPDDAACLSRALVHAGPVSGISTTLDRALALRDRVG